MNAAGSNGGKIASKYRDKGLRVIAIDVDGRQKASSQQKWKDAGADFYIYDSDGNCFRHFFTGGGVPHNVAIKEWKSEYIGGGDVGESEVKNAFGF